VAIFFSHRGAKAQRFFYEEEKKQKLRALETWWPVFNKKYYLSSTN
jgi:hypothetical protein